LFILKTLAIQRKLQPSAADSPPENENGVQEQAQNEDQFDEAPLRGSMRQHYPPPANKVPKKYDDMSTLTWDPGY
jgi:hypothetical protein